MTNIRHAVQSSVEIVEPDQSKQTWTRVLIGVLLLASLLALVSGGFASAFAFAVASATGWSKPFDDNRAAGKRTLSHNGRMIVGLTAFIVGIVVFPSTSTTASSTAQTKSAADVPGSTVTGADYGVAEGASLRVAPDAAAEQVSVAVGSDQTMTPVTIEPSMQVREIRRNGKWSEVRLLLLPSDLGNAQGWVESASLRPVPRSANGRRIYDRKDFEWYGDSARYQAAFVTVANKVMRENPACEAVNTQSVLMDHDTKGATLKFTCFGTPEQVIDFRPADATNGRSFVPAAPVVAIDKESARTSCEAAARERASHPSTVDVSMMNGKYTEYSGGDAVYQTTFTAKNTFNLELNYDIRCSFKGAEFTNVEIAENAN